MKPRVHVVADLAPATEESGTMLVPVAVDLVRADADDELLARLKAWAEEAGDAYSSRTIEALRSDAKMLRSWCFENGHDWLPAGVETVLAFIKAFAPYRRPASIARYLASWSMLHRAARLPSPTDDPRVKLRKRAHANQKGRQQRQAAALGQDEIATILVALEAPDAALRLPGYRPEIARLAVARDKALLALLSDTLVRSFEIQFLRWDDIVPGDPQKGDGSITIPRTKGHYSDGRAGYLAPRTMRYLIEWRRALVAHIAALKAEGKGVDLPEDGGAFIFWALSPQLRNRLGRNAVWAIVKAGGRLAFGTDRFSGHSPRVGTTRDIVRTGAGVLAAAHAGGWKRPDMVLAYARGEIAQQGAVAHVRAKAKPRIVVTAAMQALTKPVSVSVP